MIDETAGEIAEMQTHSSSVVAVKAANALTELLDREFPSVGEYLRTLDQNSSALRRANPSHASLHTTQHRIVDQVKGADPTSIDEAKAETQSAIESVVSDVEMAKKEAADNAQSLLAESNTILTHDYSTTVLTALEQATEAGEEFTVYVTEARPRFLGRKMARQLATIDGVEPRLIVDSAGGQALSSCDHVLVGMSAIVDDTLYNRVGTYPLAATAADANVPMSVLGSSAKVTDGGFSFINDYRSTTEVMREPADEFTIENPAYDATPVRLLESVVTDEGVRNVGEL